MVSYLYTETEVDVPNDSQSPVKLKGMNVNWESYKISILTLSLKIYASDWEPDHIVCIGRRGMNVGDGLAHLFNKPLDVIMHNSFGDDGEILQGNLNIAERISTTRKLSGKVLLVSDLVDSSKSFSELKGLVKEKHLAVTEVKTAVIYQKISAEYQPDYHVKGIDEKVWIILPNDMFDRMRMSKLNKDFVKSRSGEKLAEFAQTIFSVAEEDVFT